MSFFKKFITGALSLAMCGCFLGCNGNGDENKKPTDYQPAVNEALFALDETEFTMAQLGGTDSLGRSVLPTVGLNDKYVGLFYFVANGYHYDKIHDISKLLEKYPDATAETSPITALSKGPTSQYYNAKESPEGKSHYWGEPLYGYYRSEDPWVIRKHLELFTYAGIDFLYLDYTNNVYYPEATLALLDAVAEMRAEGYDAPQITFFMSHADPGGLSYIMGDVVRTYFTGDNIEKYKDCWFRWDKEHNPDQKPMLVGNWDNAGPTYEDDFYLRHIQWPGQQFMEDALPWMDWNVKQRNHNGVMNVSLAQGLAVSSEAYYNKNITYRARGWTPENFRAHGYDEESVLSGVNFDWQWQNALGDKDELEMITVTGWNEWIVTKLLPDDSAAGNARDRASFIDCFDMAYSRDAEMMKGGYGDNYYMQMTSNIRKFKGEFVDGSDNVALFPKTTVTTLSDLTLWNDVKAKYLDLGMSTINRNHAAFDPTIKYENETARNDIDYIKLCNDGEKLYVAVTVKGDEIIPYTAGDKTWMNLFLSCGGKGWDGYDFIVNRTPDSASGVTSVERLTENGTGVSLGSASYAVSGNTIVYAIPLSVLGVKEKSVIGVKATDNVSLKIVDSVGYLDVDEFFISGDSAPMGRLNYIYKLA